MYITVFGQETRIASGTYTFYASGDMSVERAKTVALDRAKIQIIAQEFGTYVQNTATTVVANSIRSSSVQVFSIGESDVRGEWLETIGEPQYGEIRYEDRLLVVPVYVKGRIREVVSAPVVIQAKVLCNGTQDRFERADFHHMDDLFLSFISPVKGYLTVYCYDGEDTVYCLLPYQSSSSGVQAIEANRKYVFFSKENNEGEETVDEIFVTAEKEHEYNRIYIIFSTNPFTKAVDEAGAPHDGLQLPRNLSFKEFNQWLARCRRADYSMQVLTKDITISK